jgi:hypothetical protein
MLVVKVEFGPFNIPLMVNVFAPIFKEGTSVEVKVKLRQEAFAFKVKVPELTKMFPIVIAVVVDKVPVSPAVSATSQAQFPTDADDQTPIKVLVVPANLISPPTPVVIILVIKEVFGPFNIPLMVNMLVPMFKADATVDVMVRSEAKVKLPVVNLRVPS